MNDFKLEYTNPDETYKVNNPTATEEPEVIEYDYYEVDIEQILSSFVYIKVPKGTVINRNNIKRIASLAAEDLDQSDWEKSDGISVESFCLIEENTTTGYGVYEHTT